MKWQKAFHGRLQTKSWCQLSCSAFLNLSKSLHQTQKRSLSFFGCQKPHLNHFPLVAGSLPVCHTVTSLSHPQMRINQGLEIRYEEYEKILPPLWLLHTSLACFLSIWHREGLSFLLFSFHRKVNQNMGMQMRWPGPYLAAITFVVS